MKSFKGIFTALLTPFNADNTVNTDSLTKLVKFNISKGIKGFYVGGSTGEAMLMSTEERKLVFSTVKKACSDDITLIAHVGTINTDMAIDMAKTAESLGYDAISAVAPFYYGFSYDAIKSYYNDIVNNVSIPMIVYNFPNANGVQFTKELANELFKNEKFIGIKHTAVDLFALNNFKKLDREIIVYNGFDEMLLAGFSMGADGGIGSTYNFMPTKYIKLYEAFINKDIATAQRIQNECNDIINKLIKYGVFASEKAILTHMGIPMGDCRRPFAKISDEGNAVMKEIATKIIAE